jgi:hypothetical protein
MKVNLCQHVTLGDNWMNFYITLAVLGNSASHIVLFEVMKVYAEQTLCWVRGQSIPLFCGGSTRNLEHTWQRRNGDISNILWSDELGCSQTHLKNTMVRNLQLLFNRVPTTSIHCYSLPEDWINKAFDEKYWTKLVLCLLYSDLWCPSPWATATSGPPTHRSTHP